MVRKSYGKMRGTRFKLKAQKVTVNRFVQDFNIGDIVKIDFASHTMPHPKFKGHTGRIASIRGAAYEVHLTDGGKLKSIFVKPEHLKK